MTGRILAIEPSHARAFLAGPSAAGSIARRPSYEALGASRGNGRPYAMSANTAVLPLWGYLSPYGSDWDEYGFGTSTVAFGLALDAAMHDPLVKRVVFACDSPGGCVEGVPELAAKVRGHRGTKLMIAAADTLMASAAYWVCAQCDEIVASPSASLGSIGVVSVHWDFSGFNEKLGIDPTVISIPAAKTEGHNYAPLGDAARANITSTIQEYYDMFIRDVARGRSTTPGEVRAAYGQGRVVSAARSIGERLADRIGTLEAVLSESENRVTRRKAIRAGAFPVETARRQMENAGLATHAGEPVETARRRMALLTMEK